MKHGCVWLKVSSMRSIEVTSPQIDTLEKFQKNIDELEVKSMRTGKVPGLDGIPNEILK